MKSALERLSYGEDASSELQSVVDEITHLEGMSRQIIKARLWGRSTT